MTETNPYQWYHDVLAGKVVELHPDSTPQPGCYRSKVKGGALVAYYYHLEDGAVVCDRNGKRFNEQLATEAWKFLARKAIPVEMYNSFIQTGRWPDESEAAAADRVAEKSTNPDAPDPASLEGLTARFLKVEVEAKAMIAAGTAPDKFAADKAADLKNTLLRLEQSFKAGREALLAPLKLKTQTINEAWKPYQDRAEQAKNDLSKKVVNPWMAAETKRAADEAAAQEAARQKLVEDFRVNNAPVPDAMAKPIEAQAVTAGSHGRKMHAREVWTAQITDRIQFLAHSKDHPFITEALEKIAAAYARSADRPVVPGLKYTEGTTAV